MVCAVNLMGIIPHRNQFRATRKTRDIQSVWATAGHDSTRLSVKDLDKAEIPPMSLGPWCHVFWNLSVDQQALLSARSNVAVP